MDAFSNQIRVYVCPGRFVESISLKNVYSMGKLFVRKGRLFETTFDRKPNICQFRNICKLWKLHSPPPCKRGIEIRSFWSDVFGQMSFWTNVLRINGSQTNVLELISAVSKNSHTHERHSEHVLQVWCAPKVKGLFIPHVITVLPFDLGLLASPRTANLTHPGRKGPFLILGTQYTLYLTYTYLMQCKILLASRKP